MSKKKDSTYICRDNLAVLDDVMFVLARLTYRDMCEFSKAVGVDSSTVNAAVESWLAAQDKEDDAK